MEFDLRDLDRIIFSNRNSIMMLSGREEEILVGPSVNDCIDACGGYVEGLGTEARFEFISDFLQVNETLLIVVDRSNFCLRKLDRETRQTSTFAGICRISGFGTLIYPTSIIKDVRNSNRLLFADSGTIKSVDLANGGTKTLLSTHDRSEVKSMLFAWGSEDLLLGFETHITIVNAKLFEERFTTLTGSTWKGGTDGGLKEARYSFLVDLVYLSSTILLAADAFNNKLRIINTKDDSVASILLRCIINETTIEISMLCPRVPVSLLVGEDLIYVGQQNGIATISCEYNFLSNANCLICYNYDVAIASKLGRNLVEVSVKLNF